MVGKVCGGGGVGKSAKCAEGAGKVPSEAWRVTCHVMLTAMPRLGQVGRREGKETARGRARACE